MSPSVLRTLRGSQREPYFIPEGTPLNQQLLNFQSDFEMTYPVVRANSDLMLSYNYPEALPTTFVYDRHGKQVFKRIGALQEHDLDSLVARLAAQP